MSRIGVAVVTHKGYLQYLPRLLESLEGQAPHELEIMYNRDMTLGAAANEAIRRLHGCQYIVRLDGDDWLSPNFLKEQADALDADEKIDCVWCDTVEATLISSGPWGDSFVLNHVEQNDLFLSCGAMYRYKVWDVCRYPDQNHGDNLQFWSRFQMNRFLAKRIPVVYAYRQHGSNMHNDKEAVARARAAHERRLSADTHGEES